MPAQVHALHREIHARRARQGLPGLRRNRRWPAALALLALIYVLFLFGQVLYKLQMLDRTMGELQATKSLLQQENAQLQQHRKQLQDKDYLERLARENLGMIKPGEKLLLPAEPGEVLPLEIPAGQNKVTD